MAAVTSLLDAMASVLGELSQVLPRGAVELLMLQLEYTVSTDDSVLGVNVLAPPGVRPEDIVIRSIPTHICPGHTLRLQLAVSRNISSASSASTAMTLTSAIAFHTHVDVVLISRGVLQELHASISPSDTGSVDILVLIPEGISSADSEIAVTKVAFAGQAVLSGCKIPARVALAQRMRTPLTLRGAAGDAWVTPCVTHDGVLFVPVAHEYRDVHIFSHDGVPISTFSVPKAEFSTFDCTTNTLLVAQKASLTAIQVDEHALSKRWSKP
jgi:hypothetical protein